MMPENLDQYCIAMGAESLSAAAKRVLEGQRAAILNEAHWGPNPIITVGFLEGESDLRKRVQAVAEEWTGQGMAKARLEFRAGADTTIRIAFRPGGSWSYLGTVAQNIPDHEQTMNFGWLTSSSSNDTLRRVVLHEFGHALGLIHEHQNPKGGIKWNRAAVIRDLKGPPSNWDLPTITNNVLKHYSEKEVTATNLDPSSIMMYPIPRSWTTNGFSAGLNKSISAKDRELIRQAYP